MARSTAAGSAAIALVRLSGGEALAIADAVLHKKVSDKPGYSAHFRRIVEGTREIDEAVVTLYKSPHSFTGEDVVEFALHGSEYIVGEVLTLLLRKGARLAEAGEFTLRAFLNGKMDLAQAEGVADLIASESAAAHKMAMQQMRGGFSKELAQLRDRLLHFAAMLELELDFSEEDVEFANRDQLKKLVEEIRGSVKSLSSSFKMGNALKKGVPTVIAGKPNAGKSTLLNTLLNEERALVSDIAGTTRDTIEETLHIDEVLFRLIDTAGIRETEDTVEQMGVDRTRKKAEEALLVLYVYDALEESEEEALAEAKKLTGGWDKLLLVANKIDKQGGTTEEAGEAEGVETVRISAKEGRGLEKLKQKMVQKIGYNKDEAQQTTVSHARHYEALLRAEEGLVSVLEGLEEGRSTEWVAADLRGVIRHLGSITGEIEVDRDILGRIFEKFCIGK